MKMHKGEEVGDGDGWYRTAVPSGWVYWYENKSTFIPDDWADHVVEYRREQAKRHGLPLPAYMRTVDEIGFCQSDAGFDAVLDRAREVTELKRAEAAAGVAARAEL